MNKEEQIAFQKRMWEERGIILTLKEDKREDGALERYKNSESYKKKIVEAKKSFSKLHFPKILDKETEILESVEEVIAN